MNFIQPYGFNSSLNPQDPATATLSFLAANPNIKPEEPASLPLLIRYLLQQNAMITTLLARVVLQKEMRTFTQKSAYEAQNPKFIISYLNNQARAEMPLNPRVFKEEKKPANSQQESHPTRSEEKESPKNQETQKAGQEMPLPKATPSPEKKEAPIQQEVPVQAKPKEGATLNPAPSKPVPLPTPMLNQKTNSQEQAAVIQKETQNQRPQTPVLSTPAKPLSKADVKEEALKLELPTQEREKQSLATRETIKLPVHSEMPQKVEKQQAPDHSHREALLKHASHLPQTNSETLLGTLGQTEQQSQQKMAAPGEFPITIPYPGSNHPLELRTGKQKKKQTEEELFEDFPEEEEPDDSET